MQKSKRLKLIKEIMLERKDLQVSELVEAMSVASESTIRRDIKDLVSDGFLIEHYGSIVLNEKNDSDVLFSVRATKNTEEKNKIAIEAAKLIKDNAFVYLDAGSTTLSMVRHISATNCIFVTNGINVATELAANHFTVHLVGGELKLITMAIVGEAALNNIKNYHFDISFIGTNGISEVGYSTPDIREGILKQAVVSHSRHSYIVADRSKFEKTTSFVFATPEECDLITN